MLDKALTLSAWQFLCTKWWNSTFCCIVPCIKQAFHRLWVHVRYRECTIIVYDSLYLAEAALWLGSTCSKQWSPFTQGTIPKEKKNVFLDMISAPLKDRSFCKELLTEILLKHWMFSSSFQFFQQCQGSLSGKWCNNKVLITANCSAEQNYTPNVLPFNICLIDGPLSSFYLAYPITDESRVC